VFALQRIFTYSQLDKCENRSKRAKVQHIDIYQRWQRPFYTYTPFVLEAKIKKKCVHNMAGKRSWGEEFHLQVQTTFSQNI